MMSYVVTEDEQTQLEAVVSQIGLLVELLDRPGEVTLNVGGLLYTLAALRAPIEAVLNACRVRHEVAAYAGMQPFHWHNLAQMMSGRGLYRWRDIVDMDERLARAVEADPAMAIVFNTWRAAMTDDGAFQMCGRDSTCLDFHAGLVRPLAIQKIEPIDAHDVARMYNVESPEDVAQALADAANRGAAQPRKNAHKAMRKRAKAHTAGR